jgi:ribose transport system permease protein
MRVRRREVRVTAAAIPGRYRPTVEHVVLLVGAAAALAFSLAVRGFASWGNLENLVRDAAPLLVLSCGMGIVVIGRGLDLSQVAAMTTVTAVFGIMILAGQPGWAALAGAFCAAVLLGLFNGWLVAYAEIPSLLATLATAMLFTGIGRWGVLRGEYLLVLPKEFPLIEYLSGGRVAGVPLSVLVAVAVAGLTWFFLSRTSYGRAVRAGGDNYFAARLTGMPTRLVTLVVYVFAALAASVAGLMIASANGTVDFRTVTNGTLLFDVIMVVVLGGISLRGGRGGILSIVAGVALIAVLRNGMTMMDLSTQVQALAKGLVLSAAVIVDNQFNPRDQEADTASDL